MLPVILPFMLPVLPWRVLMPLLVLACLILTDGGAMAAPLSTKDTQRLTSPEVSSELPELPKISEMPWSPLTLPVPELPVPDVLFPESTQAAQGLRGMWVDAFGKGLKTRIQIMQMLDDAEQLGINTLFVQAIRRGDCLCLKSTLPPVTDADLEKGLDPLGFVTEQAHARGLKVIAWASVTGIANVASPSRHPQHVMRLHGANSSDSWLARRPDGTWKEGNDGWLDVGIPAAAEYAAQAVVSLVKNYPIDGVQLDRIRYPDGGAWGYDSKTIARYRRETSQKGTPKPNDPEWQAWKREQVTGLVRRIALEVKHVRPELWVSAATIVYGAPPAHTKPAFQKSPTYRGVLQDWVTWIEEGLIDLNVTMNYKRDGIGEQSAWFDGWNRFAARMNTRLDGGKALAAAGVAWYLNGTEVSGSQSARALSAGLDGWVGYAYRSLTPKVLSGQMSLSQGVDALAGQLKARTGAHLAARSFTEKPPTMRGVWGQVRGTQPGGQRVEAWVNGKRISSVLTDGNGHYGFLILPEGKVEVRVAGQVLHAEVPSLGVTKLPLVTLK